MVMDDLTRYLEANVTAQTLTRGTNLFYGLLPPSPDLAVSLFEYGSLPPALTLGNSEINIEYPQVHVLVRGAEDDYDTPRVLINDIVAKLTAIGEQDINGVRYHTVSPKQSPFFLRRDDAFRVEFACNFHVMKDWG